MGKFGKIQEASGKKRENSGKSGKFGKVRGRTGEKPGKNWGSTGEEPENLPKNENFAKKKPGKNRGMGAKLAQNAILSNFDVESGNLSVSAPFLGVLARFCCFCAFFVLFFLVEFSRVWGTFTNFRKFWTKMQIENAE